jgi:hypothetical protein
VTRRSDRASICLLDTCSAVRHLGICMFSVSGYEVYVFYSPETFVRSGAAASVDILILGHTRICLAENETLRWVGTYRPDIKTIVLGDGPALVHRLPDLFRTPSIATVHEKSMDRIVRLPRALHLFCESRTHTNANSYPTIKHRLIANTCTDTSTLSDQELLYEGAVVTHADSGDNRIRNYVPSGSEPLARHKENFFAEETDRGRHVSKDCHRDSSDKGLPKSKKAFGM